MTWFNEMTWNVCELVYNITNQAHVKKQQQKNEQLKLISMKLCKCVMTPSRNYNEIMVNWNGRKQEDRDRTQNVQSNNETRT